VNRLLDRRFGLVSISPARALFAYGCEATPSAALRRRDLLRNCGDLVDGWFREDR
jgi:hypothetical protein